MQNICSIIFTKAIDKHMFELYNHIRTDVRMRYRKVNDMSRRIIRNIRKNKKSFLARFSVITVLVFCIVLFATLKTTTASGDTGRTKYFKSIEIESGDTLWSIAEEYISEEYDDINEYIGELKKMNGLYSDNINAGCYLVVCYYSSEIK